MKKPAKSTPSAPQPSGLPPLLVAPNGEPLPIAYRWLRAHGLAALRPWHFIDDAGQAQRLRGEFALEVAPPNESAVRDLAPFAQRLDRDDVAGFSLHGGVLTGEVCLVTLTWRGRPEQKGWPTLLCYKDFWAFAKEALLEDARDWANEEALARLLPPQPK